MHNDSYSPNPLLFTDPEAARNDTLEHAKRAPVAHKRWLTGNKRGTEFISEPASKYIKPECLLAVLDAHAHAGSTQKRIERFALLRTSTTVADYCEAVRLAQPVEFKRNKHLAFNDIAWDYDRYFLDIIPPVSATKDTFSDNRSKIILESDADPAPFDPYDIVDGRDRINRTIIARRGQREFRNALISAYGGQCAVTGCNILAVLEAAHIIPYFGEHTNHVANGVLLRADIHTLFDLNYITIESINYNILVAAEIRESEYGDLNLKTLTLPVNPINMPSKTALKKRESLFK